MKKRKSHCEFNRQERSGIFFLLLFIVILQISYFVLKSYPQGQEVPTLHIDSTAQLQLDTFRKEALQKRGDTVYPFNPNFITDYKGYRLGMSVAEIDRLVRFRSNNRYVSSAEEFQEVTGVSDSLLNTMVPYFKFPDWTKTSKSSEGHANTKSFSASFEIKDLNQVTVEELRAIRGIGTKLSERIVKFRDRLGGFLVDEQLYDVYGLEAQVAERTLKRFKVLKKPGITKININTASVSEMVKLVYIRYAVAKEIVAYREANGPIQSFDELQNITDFPFDKIDRIALYLSL